ncbi:MAG: DUF386 domain-containing protein [Bacteroidales bacterium]|nr:DUF386 domain-containing protein [Bacteroidales bacterium]
MKKLFIPIIMAALISGLSGCNENTDPSLWSEKKTDEWFSKTAWYADWNVKPDPSVSKKEMAVAWHKNKERWQKAFSFLKETNLDTLELRRYDLDGNNLYVLVSEYQTKDENEAKFEAHRRYADIQYVAKGSEIIQITPLAMRDTITQEYDATRDIEFFTVKEHASYNADPGRFFVFFPGDAHKPGLRTGPEPQPVRKIVVKLLLD